jgi:hypothetical protein
VHLAQPTPQITVTVKVLSQSEEQQQQQQIAQIAATHDSSSSRRLPSAPYPHPPLMASQQADLSAYLAELSEEQQAAVRSTEQHVKVIAGERCCSLIIMLRCQAASVKAAAAAAAAVVLPCQLLLVHWCRLLQSFSFTQAVDAAAVGLSSSDLCLTCRLLSCTFHGHLDPTGP